MTISANDKLIYNGNKCKAEYSAAGDYYLNITVNGKSITITAALILFTMVQAEKMMRNTVGVEDIKWWTLQWITSLTTMN